MAIKFTMTNVKIGKISGGLVDIDATAYLECGSCGKHTIITNNTQKGCSHCGSSQIGRLETGDKPPAWFKDSEK